jgi:predicted membrane-bound spermidine synthase
MARAYGIAAPLPRRESARPPAEPPFSDRRSGLLLCFFLSGATALVYEIVWLRMLGLVFGHTVYALTTVLAAFMAGLGLGSVLFGRRAAGFREPIRVYAILEIAIGVSCGLTPALIPILSQARAGEAGAIGRTVGARYAVNTFGAVAGAMLAG